MYVNNNIIIINLIRVRKSVNFVHKIIFGFLLNKIIEINMFHFWWGRRMLNYIFKYPTNKTHYFFNCSFNCLRVVFYKPCPLRYACKIICPDLHWRLLSLRDFVTSIYPPEVGRHVSPVQTTMFGLELGAVAPNPEPLWRTSHNSPI